MAPWSNRKRSVVSLATNRQTTLATRRGRSINDASSSCFITLKPLHILIPIVILICLVPFHFQQQYTVSTASSLWYGGGYFESPPRQKPQRVRNKHNRTRLHKPLVNLSQEERRLELLNSVDYYACCGLGHRLTKLSDAYFVAQQINYAFKSFWGYCNEHTEVFNALFGSQPVDQVTTVSARRRMLILRNEVPGTKPLIRYNFSSSTTGRECASICSISKIKSDQTFYQSLWDRFQYRHLVENFMDRHNFSDHYVIGMHIRAGNNETGDFTNKGRTIGDLDTWIPIVANHVRTTLLKHNKQDDTNTKSPPLLYIATDTPFLITQFQQALPELPVIELSQPRTESGVFFGAPSAMTSSGNICMEGWINAMVELMLLSSVDLLIAARPSSFVQSMPMTRILTTGNSNNNNNNNKRVYCELPPDATYIQCFDSYTSWCCNANTVAFMQGIQTYEYVRMPEANFNMSSISHKMKTRRDKELVLPMHLSATRKTDLPFSWTNLVAKIAGQ